MRLQSCRHISTTRHEGAPRGATKARLATFAALLVALLIVSGLALAGCGDDASRDDPGTQTGELTEANGRVESIAGSSGGSSDVSGATISAFTLSSSGQLETISVRSATVGATGEYELELQALGVVPQIVIIEASMGDDSASIAFETALVADTSVAVAPIDGETSVETDVYLEARASSSWDAEAMDLAGVRALVAADVATDLQSQLAAEGEAAYESDVDIVADGTTAAMLAFYDGLTDTWSGASEGAVETYFEARAAAQTQLDAALAADESAGVAIEAYHQAVVGGAASAGLSADQLAFAAQAASEAMEAQTVQLSGELNASARSELEAQRAELVSRAVVEAYTSLEANGQASSDSVVAVESAGADLMTSIEDAYEAGLSVSDEVASAWADYEAEVMAEVEASITLAVESAWETTETSIGLAADSLFTALAEISGDAGSSTTAIATVSAMSDFYVAATAETQVDALVTAGLDETMAQSLVTIVAHVEAAVHATADAEL